MKKASTVFGRMSLALGCVLLFGGFSPEMVGKKGGTFDFASGISVKYTDDVIAATMDGVLSTKNGKRFQAVFYWDNENLFGTAKVCGDVVEELADGSFIIKLDGVFDISNLGGWPANTVAPIHINLTWDYKNAKTALGSYHIEAKGNFPSLYGTIYSEEITKRYSYEDLEQYTSCK